MGTPLKNSIAFNETCILDVVNVGVVGVKKKKYSFHKKKKT